MPAAKTLRTKITQAVVTSCLKNRGVRQVVKDTELRGLRLEIGPLSASWVLEYRPQGLLEDGRRPSSKSYKFGDVHSHTPPEARVEASKLKNLIKDGQDPSVARKSATKLRQLEAERRTSVSALAEAYIASYNVGTAKNITTETGALRRAITEMGVGLAEPKDVLISDVSKMLSLHLDHPSTARHRLGALKRFFDHLVEAGHADGNPCERIAKRQRPKPSKPRTRYYSAAETQRLWATAEQIPAAYGNYLRAMLYCPLKASEMANMRCSNVELDNKRLVLSALETKNGDPFSMPLSDAAVTLFQSCVGGKASTDLVFPLAGEKPMTSWKSLLNSVRKASDIPDFGWHHIRRTFMTTLADQGIGSADVADALLNHRQSASRSGVRAAYDHSALWPRKVDMMRAWSDLLQMAFDHGCWTSPSESQVIDLRQNSAAMRQ